MKFPHQFLENFILRKPPNPSAKIFNRIYLENLWEDPESASGPGSNLVKTQIIREQLPNLFAFLGISSLLDAPCGDFNWMRLTQLTLTNYVGVDIVSSLIERNNRLYARRGQKFVVADITRDKLPRCQAILCRDCFIHLPASQIFNTLKNFQQSPASYLIATNHPAEETYQEINTGEWRPVNLHLPPFNLPQPLVRLVENPVSGKSLDVWELQKLALRVPAL